MEYLVLGLVGLGIYTGGLVLGVLAFLRLERYRKALIEQQLRIDALEAALAGHGPLPLPAPQAAAPPAQIAAPTMPARVVERPAVVHPPAPVEPIFPEPSVPATRAPKAAAAVEPAQPLDLGTWALWGAGAAIAFAVIAFLNNAYNQGFFNQASQLLLGYVMAAGLIGGAEVLRRRAITHPPQDLQSRHTPKILAAAGLVCAYGITFVGFARLALLPPPAAIGLMGLCALGAFALSLWHGRLTAWFGVFAGFGAPALVGSSDTPATAIFLYLFAICAGAFALSRYKKWYGLGWAAAAAAIGWSAWWTFGWFSPSGVSAASIYLVAITVLGVAFAWDEAREARRVPLPATHAAWIGLATIIGAGTALAWLVTNAHGFGSPAVYALIAATGVTAVFAAWRPALSPAPALLGVSTVVALALWPEIDTSGAARTFVGFSGALGFAASVGGWTMMARNPAPGAGAVVAALLPTLALFIAHTRLGTAIDQPSGWGIAALSLAGFNAVALDRISSAVGGASKAPLATGAFAFAAAACAAMAGMFALNQVHLAAGVAALIIPLALLDGRLNLPPTRIAAMLLAVVAVALLSPIALWPVRVAPTPVLNTLTPTFAIAMASVWVGARLFARGPAGYLARVTIVLRVALVGMVIAFLWAQIRQIANGGVLAAPYTSLWEAGAHTSALMLIAIVAAWRFGGKARPLLHWTERLAFLAAVVHFALAALVLLSPWWGSAPAQIVGPPLLNNLLFAYGLPALLFATYAFVRGRMGSAFVAQAAGAAAVVAAVTWALLTVRHAFHPTTASTAVTLPWEHAAYSATLAVSAVAALAITYFLRATELRYASAALAMAAFGKALVIDAAQIDGPVKFAAYALLAAMAAATFIGFQRYIFPRGPARPPINADAGSTRDGTLLPPRP